MLHQIIEIQEEGRYLSLERGFLRITQKDEHLASVPLDDIAVLLISAQSVSFSKHILNEIAERGGISILCGKNYLPQSMVIPAVSHSLQTDIINEQINTSLPFKKNTWQQVVEEKLKNQAKVLKILHQDDTSEQITHISQRVRSGDPDNREAYGARLYWKALFGNKFIRDKDGDGINALLNYGYAVMRASMVRAICSAGLLPSLGIHHSNKLNPFCLGDDFFEPFRPLVDYAVFLLTQEGKDSIDTKTKQTLAKVLWYKVKTAEGFSPIFQSFHYMAASYVKAIRTKKPGLDIPEWEGKNEEVSSSEQI